MLSNKLNSPVACTPGKYAGKKTRHTLDDLIKYHLNYHKSCSAGLATECSYDRYIAIDSLSFLKQWCLCTTSEGVGLRCFSITLTNSSDDISCGFAGDTKLLNSLYALLASLVIPFAWKNWFTLLEYCVHISSAASNTPGCPMSSGNFDLVAKMS